MNSTRKFREEKLTYYKESISCGPWLLQISSERLVTVNILDGANGLSF